MKTTLNFPDALIAQAKRRALDEGTTLTEIIKQGLNARLGKGLVSGPLPVSTAAGGLCAGIRWEDLEAAEGMYEAYR